MTSDLVFASLEANEPLLATGVRTVRQYVRTAAHPRSLLPVHILSQPSSRFPIPPFLVLQHLVDCSPVTMCIPKTSPFDLHVLKCPCCKLNNLSKCTHPRYTCQNQANHRSYNQLSKLASRCAPLADAIRTRIPLQPVSRSSISRPTYRRFPAVVTARSALFCSFFNNFQFRPVRSEASLFLRH